MLRIAASRILARQQLARPTLTSIRSFADEYGIPTDAEQQAGRRKEELDAEARGEVGFNKDPIIPAANAGTKENPILVR